MENKSNLITYEKLEYLDVVDNQGQYIGEIEDILINPAGGEIAYAIISLDDGCGKEEKLYILPWKDFQYDQEKSELKLKLDRKTIEKSKSFSEHNYPDFSKFSTNQP